MATVSKFTRGAVAGNAWTSPANATASDGVYATAAPAKNGTVSGSWDWDAFLDSEIPVGATINSVTLEVKWKVSTTASIATFHYRTSNGGTLGTDQTDTTEPTADKISTTTVWSSVPTEAQLKTVGQLAATIAGQRGNSTTGVTFSLDYARLTVDFTAPAAAFVGQADGIAAALAGLTTAIPLGATAAGVGAPTGSLATSIVLAGNSAGGSTAAASAMSIAGAALTGSSAGMVATSGALATGIALGGSSAGLGVPAAALATAIRLVAATAGLATASGNLATGIPLAGQSAGVASAVAALLTGIALAGTASGGATTTSSLSGAALLSGSTAGASTAAAALITAIRLAGSSPASASSSASLATAIRLLGSTAGTNTGSASLTTGIKSVTGALALSDAAIWAISVSDQLLHIVTVSEAAV